MEPNRADQEDADIEGEIEFLTLAQIKELHEEAIQTYSPNEPREVINQEYLASAVQTPQQTWNGGYLYQTIAEMAAAYLIGLVCNHGFANGNKRVGFAACSTFLRMNGYRLTMSNSEATQITLNVVTHVWSREDLVDFLNDAIEPL